MHITRAARNVAKQAYHWFLLNGAEEGTVGEYVYLVDPEANSVRVRHGSLTYIVPVAASWC